MISRSAGWAGLVLGAMVAFCSAGHAANKYVAKDLGLPYGVEAQPIDVNRKQRVAFNAYDDTGMSYRGYITKENGEKPKVVPTLGGTLSWVAGFDGSGRVVGDASLPGDFENHIMVIDNGLVRDLGTLGGGYSYSSAVNQNGVLVGTSVDGEGLSWAVYADPIKGYALEKIGITSAPFDVNSKGRVVGRANVGSQTLCWFFDVDGGQFQTLPTDNLPGCTPVGINDKNQIVGQLKMGGGIYKAFVTDEDGVTPLDLGIESSNSAAYAINNGGTIVGWYTDGIGAHAFVTHWPGLRINKLDELVADLPAGVSLTYATAVNNHGVIVAEASNGHAYMLTPLTSSTDHPTPVVHIDTTITNLGGTTTLQARLAYSVDEGYPAPTGKISFHDDKGENICGGKVAPDGWATCEGIIKYMPMTLVAKYRGDELWGAAKSSVYVNTLPKRYQN